MPAPIVRAVSRNAIYGFSKPEAESIRLITGLGVEDDIHAGETVKHRSRVARNPSAPNLRQVHLIHAELFDELRAKGFLKPRPGALGENVTTGGIDLLGLSAGTRLRLGREAIIEVTGLRNPCSQLDAFEAGLMGAVLEKSRDGRLVRKAGIMAIVISGGGVRAGDAIEVVALPAVHAPLEPV
ncbi:MAG TPA: MOSC domain-containing protein [Hyphomicrobiaceae bacterium]|nr:MOSC domain-containing protein [Hyphomicrobiaceae bacterium]